ncbi:MAG TPA: sigma-70 family RNA polymerase sigma factor [Ktedonobacteraceae bacterium]|nr:sigma-70 family RNA polymerase sigma factor [Ktedonobacteraceae bacterium]
MEQLRAEEAQNAANAAFYDRFAPAIFAYLYQQVASRQDAEDILLEVFMAAQRQDALYGLGDEQRLTWLKRVARNKVIDCYRHSALLPLLPLDRAVEQEDRALTPEQQVVQRESYERLYQAIEQLSLEQQQLIRLRYGNGLRLVEIAEMLEKPDGTVRKMLARALQQLRAHYEQAEKGTQR